MCVLSGSDVDLQKIGSDPRCDGYSGADMSALVREASMSALREALKNSVSTPISVSKVHFERAFYNLKPSVGEKDQLKYRAIQKKFCHKLGFQADPTLAPEIDLTPSNTFAELDVSNLQTRSNDLNLVEDDGTGAGLVTDQRNTTSSIFSADVGSKEENVNFSNNPNGEEEDELFNMNAGHLQENCLGNLELPNNNISQYILPLDNPINEEDDIEMFDDFVEMMDADMKLSPLVDKSTDDLTMIQGEKSTDPTCKALGPTGLKFSSDSNSCQEPGEDKEDNANKMKTSDININKKKAEDLESGDSKVNQESEKTSKLERDTLIQESKVATAEFQKLGFPIVPQESRYKEETTERGISRESVGISEDLWDENTQEPLHSKSPEEKTDQTVKPTGIASSTLNVKSNSQQSEETQTMPPSKSNICKEKTERRDSGDTPVKFDASVLRYLPQMMIR